MNVKTLCLGTLCLSDASGYDIKKLFEAAFSHFHSASYGSIYPALAQLEAEGLVTHRQEPGGGHPDRKVFRITDPGRERFLRELAAAEPTEQLRSEFLVQMFFAHLLSTERMAQILDQVEASYRQALGYLESIHGLPGHTTGIRFTIGMGIAAIGAQLEYLVAQREAVLSTHRDGTATDGGTPA